MSNRLNPDQARRFDGPDLGPNCLQMLSVDGIDASKHRVNKGINNNYIVASHKYHIAICRYSWRYHGESFCLFVLMFTS